MSERLIILPIWVWLLIAPFWLAGFIVYAFFRILWELLRVIGELIGHYNAKHPLERCQRRSKASPPSIYDVLPTKPAPGPRDWSPKDE